MPEGDTVWLACHTLDNALRNKRVQASDFRVPALSTESLVGASVLSVVPRGKHLLMRFDDGRTLRSHLRMDGTWHLYAPGAAWDRRAAHLIRVVITTEDGTAAVGYHLHELALVPTARESELVGHLGPDLLAADFDLRRAVDNLAQDPSMAIGPALLDQRNLAGIGNLYKAESLFLEHLNPWTPIGAINNLEAIVTRAQRLLLVNRDRFEQCTTGDLRRGFHHWVFERADRPCRRCGTTIRCELQGSAPRARLTYWCPRCQPAAGAGPG